MCKSNKPTGEVNTEPDPLQEEEMNEDDAFLSKIITFRNWVSDNFPYMVGQPLESFREINDPEQQKLIQLAACRCLGWEVLDDDSNEGWFFHQLHMQFCRSCRERQENL
jgi:hypothetical protein